MAKLLLKAVVRLALSKQHISITNGPECVLKSSVPMVTIATSVGFCMAFRSLHSNKFSADVAPCDVVLMPQPGFAPKGGAYRWQTTWEM